MTTQRTPGPWRVETWHYPNRGDRLVVQNDTEAVCEIYPLWRAGDPTLDPTSPEGAAANGAFIVLACNNHDKLTAQVVRLREALRDLTEWFHDVPRAFTVTELLQSGCPNDLQASLTEARAALAETEE